ncbi:MAG: tricarballylate utilization 4Fe-4S protein TcuB [Burkholderiaceae bacterium]
MRTLDRLASEARDLAAGGAADDSAAEHEAARQLQICNACRYCEGFCAVFPAMTRRLEFPSADVHYLANLCHNCGACLHACQYASPHEFAVDMPQAMARVRGRTYARHAWPGGFARLYARNGLTLAAALAGALALMLALAIAMQGDVGALWRRLPGGSFYALLPHGLLVALFAPAFAFALLAIGVGVSRFWRDEVPGPAGAAALGEAAQHALRLSYLDGGHGEGCTNDDDAWTLARRRAHHLVFYGFASCFAATCVATLYHYAFGWHAPYGWASLPKGLGVAGGVAMVIGCAWLWRLRVRRHPQHVLAEQRGMDLGFIALLGLAAASGIALALLRETAAMPLVLCVHLGAVMALFATMPYGKFVHGAYRAAALVKWAIERRQPNRLQLGNE